MRKRRLSIFALIGLLSLSCVGCNASNPKQDSIDDSAIDANSQNYENIGSIGSNKSDNVLEIINETGQEIISFTAWPVGTSVEFENSLSGFGSIPKNASVDWKYPDINKDHPLLYIQIMLKDGTHFILRDIDLTQIDQNHPVLFVFENNTGYIKYTDKKGNTVNNLEEQKSLQNLPLQEDYDDEHAIIGLPVDDED